MEASSYITVSRQGGLMNEMRIVANNIANVSTTGFRQEGLVFSEFVQSGTGDSSLSMSRAPVRNTSFISGAIRETGGRFDFAIEGDGYFLIETQDGERLTRAGNFTPNGEGDLVTTEGARVLDAGGAPLFVPQGVDLAVSADGTISADGQPIGQIGLVRPANPLDLQREDGVMFSSEGGVEPAEDARVLQGFLEGSNVNPMLQVARMIEVQRAYEMGQSFLENEDQRIRDAIKSILRS